jgi:hypothetical protein
MKTTKLVKNTACAIALVGLSGLTAAFGNASQSISIRGEVPLICRVSLSGGSSDFSADGTASLGTASEFCNSGSGYRVYARADGDVSGANIVVDGVSFPLRAGAEFVIASSSTANSISRNIVYDAGNTDGGGRLSLRIAAN